MKFLCDSCKAKYQIADEKVAGKTVRMKCRKCGHQIEVRAAITETSVASAPPGPVESLSPPRSALATSLSATKPRAPAPPAPAGSGALAGAFQRTVQDAPNAAQLTSPAQATSIELSVTDEWYVAINGVPVGPVRISELRRKAATGAVTEDSLCWQEGLEEWRPVRSLPELAAIVREAAQGNRPSLLTPPAPEPRPGPAPPPPRAAPARPQPGAPRTPEPSPPRVSGPAAPPSRNNVVPLHGPRVAASAAEDLPPATAPLGGAAAAFAPATALGLAPTPSPSPAGALQPSLAQAPAPNVVPDPFAVSAPAPAPAMGSGVSVVTGGASATAAAPVAPASVSMPPPAPRRGAPLWFWGILVFAAVFGVAAAYFVFRAAQPPVERVVIKEVAAPTPTPTATDVPPPPPSTEPTASAPAASGRPVVGTRPTTAPTPTATSTSKTADLSGLLGGVGGPSVGPNGPSGGSAGGTLDGATVQRIVRDRSPAVKRTCWERGGNDQKSSAKVTVAITVGPSGRVDNASASGDDPVIAKCIENQVRGWTFPATGSTTTVNVPFVFVRQ